ncbi:M48 family metallopeptidase [Aestuariispira insulae]|uniref:Zn-dependent protease with chaperone function n=1 Tax=Aestuariispira insulae TaxID=1461337 RepID=A0A3D9HY81_9PROT|nr:M48 family metallopeptidase [Aestuariispira insulae]RED53866.1 Zn-dependent protease with chaperone function [Aestuariispira insulae]
MENWVAKDCVCPDCGSQIHAVKEFRQWYPTCEWNIGKFDPADGDSWIERIFRDQGVSHGNRLYEEIRTSSPEALRPKWTASRILATILSLSVHLLTAALALAGGYFLIFGWPSIPQILLGLTCLVLFFLMRPRFGKAPENGLSRHQAPSLFSLCDRIADQVGSPRPDLIIVDEDFNAAFGQVGFPRKTVLWIGLPLWEVLDWEERVAVLAHEFSHGANGDATRGFFMHSALLALAALLDYLRQPYDPDATIFEMVTHYFLWGLSWLVLPLLWLMLILLWRDSQRAEFLADYLATSASGTQAMKTSLSKLALSDQFHHFASKNIVSTRQSGREILKRSLSHLQNLPACELDRLSRLSQKEDARLDATHPPTCQRIGFIQSHFVDNPTIRIEDEERNAITAEFEAQKDHVGTSLIQLWAPDR